MDDYQHASQAMSLDQPGKNDLWPLVSLEDLAADEPHSITDGPFGSKLKGEHYTKSGPRVIRLQNIGDGVFVDAHAHISRAHFNTLQRHRVFAGDLVIAGLGETLPRSCIIPESVGPAVVKADCIRLKPGPRVLPRFLNFALNSDFVRSQARGIVHGVGRPRLNQSEIKALKIPLPPVNVQAKLVEEIDRVFTKLETGVAALARTQAHLIRYRTSVLKAACEGTLVPTDSRLAQRGNGVFQSADELIASTPLLPKPARWKGRTTDIVEGHPALWIGKPTTKLPEGWTWVPIVDVAKMESGHTPSRRHPEWWSGQIPWIGIRDAKAFHGHTIHDTTQHVNQAGLKNSAARLLPAGTVCVSRTASIGYVVVMGRPMATSQDFANWVPTAAVTSDWLRIVFSADREALMRFGKGSVHKTIYFPELLAIHIALPPLVEQRRIAAEVDRRLSVLEELQSAVAINRQRAEGSRGAFLKQKYTEYTVPIATQQRRAPLSDEASGATITRKRHSVDAAPVPASMKLIRLKVFDDFNSLKAFDFVFRKESHSSSAVSPICLVGLNGSGKSNLIEAFSEILCHLELSLLSWKSIRAKHRGTKLRFVVEYEMKFEKGPAKRVLIEKPTSKPATFKVVDGETIREVTEADERLALLPARVIGYSSGLNETVSIPFFRTAALYSEEVRNHAQEEEASDEKRSDVESTRSLFVDYDCNALILVANLLFQPKRNLDIFSKRTRVKALASFAIRFRPTYQGNKTVKLTHELRSYVASFRKCADRVTKEKSETEIFHFDGGLKAARKLKKFFPNSGAFFTAAYKLSLLNALALKGQDRKFFLREDAKAGQLERPPTVSREDRVFSIEKIRLQLTRPRKVIDYAGISDGEHQFLQVFGTVMLFGESGCLFLLDEPETHFNPQWRRHFVQTLTSIKSTSDQEIIISTHSPFVVSGCRGDNVFKFERHGGHAICAPVGIETFGASYDFLLARLFDLKTMVSEQALTEMREVLKSSDLNRLENALGEFGESLEKRFIFERIAELRAEKH